VSLSVVNRCPAVGELAAQFGEVVGLPRVDERDRAVRRVDGHRLTAAGQVDDREPAVAEGRGTLDPVPRSSGPRQAIVSVIASNVAASVRSSRSKETQPVMPHMRSAGQVPLTCVFPHV
jgi:hypothetical protein